MNVREVKTNSSLIFIFIIAVFFSACTKIVTTDIGNGLIPPIDGVITKDTSIEVLTKNAGDSVIRPGLGENHVLGYVNDPLFGKTTAAINVQLKPTNFPYSFDVPKDSLFIDSVVLALGYQGVWGDSNQVFALRVFELTNDDPHPFSADSVYTNLSHFDSGLQLTENGLPKFVKSDTLSDSVHVFQDSGINQLRIRLNASLGQTFLNFDTTNAYLNDSTFNRYFKGFQISADPLASSAMNGLLKINLLDPNTKLAIYYKFWDPVTVGKKDTAVRYFTANTIVTNSSGIAQYASAHSNYIVRNRTGAQIASFYPSANPVDSLLFLEAMPGVFTKIQIPGLKTFPNVIIHRAELLMQQVPDNTNPSEPYLAPPDLFLAAYSYDSSRRFILYNDVFDIFGSTSGTPDFANFGSFPIHNYDISTNKIYYTYNFNISRYVQSIVTKKDSSYNLILYAPFDDPYIYSSPLSTFPFPIFSTPLNNPACGRIRLRGGSTNKNDSLRMRLHIIYSLL